MNQNIHAAKQPLSKRLFRGVGVQVDCFLYDETNREAGVTAEDIALYEQRLAALRPGAARVFVAVSDFNPSFDAHTYEWERAEFQRQLAGLKRLDGLGIPINICMSPWTNTQMRQEGMEVTALAAPDGNRQDSRNDPQPKRTDGPALSIGQGKSMPSKPKIRNQEQNLRPLDLAESQVDPTIWNAHRRFRNSGLEFD